MVWKPTDAQALQWALDAAQGNGQPYEPELVDGLACLRAIQPHGSVRPSRGPYCYEFDGLAAHVNIGAVTPMADWSIAFFMKTSATPLQYLATWNAGSFGFFTNGLSGYGVYDGTTVTGNTRNLHDGEWHHVAITKSGTTWLVYIDGILDETATMLDQTITAFGFGYRADNSLYANALMREVLTYDVVKDATQVAALAAGGADQDGIGGDYHCNEEKGGQTFNSASNSGHGLIKNAVLTDLHTTDAAILENPANRDGYTLGRNYCLQSESINLAPWTVRNTVVVTPNDEIAPDGNLTADRIADLQSGNDLYQIGNLTGFTNTDDLFTPSFWIKKATPDQVINITNASNGGVGGSWQLDFSQLSTDWERITPTHPAVTISTPFRMNGQLGGIQFGNNQGGAAAAAEFHLWGVQFEIGSEPGSYQRTEASNLLDVIIPQDASDPANDALLGEPLDFTGLAPMSIATQTPVATGDQGTLTYARVDGPETDITGPLTIAGWMYPGHVSQEGYVAYKSPNGTAGYMVFFQVAQNNVLFRVEGTSLVSDPVFTDLDQWVHIAATLDDAGNGAIYRNGELAGQAAGMPFPNSYVDSLMLLGNATSSGGTWSHPAREIVVAPRAFTQDEIRYLFDGSGTNPGIDFLSWPMCEGAGEHLANVNADRNHALIINANLASWWAGQAPAKDYGIQHGGRNTLTMFGDGLSAGTRMEFSGLPATMTKLSYFSRMRRASEAQISVLAAGNQLSSGLGFNCGTAVGGSASRFLDFKQTNSDYVASTLNTGAFVDEWVDFGFIFDNGQVTFLLGDDSDVQFLTSTEITSAEKSSLWGTEQNGLYSLPGQVARSTMWTAAKTVADYNAWRAGAADAIDLFADWGFNDNRGNLIRDGSGNNRDGLLIDHDGAVPFEWQFSPALLDGSGTPGGNPITLAPGHHNNSGASLIFDPWGAGELLDLEYPAESPPGQLLRNIEPTSRKFRSEITRGITGAGDFSALNARVDAPTARIQNGPTDPMTIEFYAQLPLPIPSQYRAVVSGDSNTLVEFGTPARLRFTLGGFTAGTLAATMTADLPRLVGWNHYAVTWDGTNCRFYQNGVLLETHAITAPTEEWDQLVLGGRSANPGAFEYEGLLALTRVYSAALTDGQVAEAYARGQTFADLVAKYDFTDQAGLTLTDSSGNGNDGTLTNVDPSVWWDTEYIDGQPFADGDDRVFSLPGVQETATFWTGTFDGVEDVISTPALVQPTGASDPFTISFWTDYKSSTTMAPIGQVNTPASEQSHGVDINTNLIKLNLGGFTDGIDAATQTNIDHDALKLNHVVVTWDGSDAKFYFNGVLAGTHPISSPTQYVNPLALGGRRVSGGIPQPYAGLLGEVHLYQRAVTGAEAADLSRGTEPGGDNLEARYLFTDQAGETLTDSSPNGNDGTLDVSSVPNFWTGQETIPAGSPHGLEGPELAEAIKYIGRRSEAGQLLLHSF